MTAMVRSWPGRLAGALAASALVVTACASGPGVPGPPSAYLGTVLDTPVPVSVADLPLVTDAGQVTSLAAWHGQVVVLTDFLTLCQETCPLTTGNMLMMDRAVMAAGLGRRVHFVELTVDPNRDTPSRLRAYRKLIGAPANWSLLTGRPAVIEQIWRYFRVWYQRVAEDTPPGTDWLTGRALSYDVDSLDYTDPGPDAIVSTVLGSTRPGSIVSLHLGHSGTVTAIPAILRGLASRGLRPVTLTELLSP